MKVRGLIRFLNCRGREFRDRKASHLLSSTRLISVESTIRSSCHIPLVSAEATP
jgi:hypothetical protein